MKVKTRILILSVLFLCLFAFPVTVFAQNPPPVINGDKVVIGQQFVLESGQTLTGNLAIFGGTGRIEKDAHVNGDVTLTGATLNIDGEINGSISAIGGILTLGDTAIIHGNITTLGATITRSDKARVDGSTNLQGLTNLSNFNLKQLTPTGVLSNLSPLADIFWFLFRILALSVMAVLVAIFMPRHIQNISVEILHNPIGTFGFGLLTVIIFPALIVIMAITIILIPVSLVGILVAFLAVMLGWFAIGHEIGRRLAELFKTEWAIPVSTGVGTLVLTLVSGVIGRIPCVGWVAPFMIGIFGLGAVLSSRFGTIGNHPTGGFGKTAPKPHVVTPLPVITPIPVIPPAPDNNPVPPEPPQEPPHGIEIA